MQRRDDFIVRLCGGCGQLTEQCECRWTTRMNGKLPKLTEKQDAILRFIAERQATGVSPSYREIAAEFDFAASTNSVECHVSSLVKKGYIAKGKRGHSRSLRVLALPE